MSGYLAAMIAFIEARLDEDEAAAKRAHDLFIRFEDKPGDWTRLMCDPVMGPFGGQSATRDVAIGLYVGAMSDPARVLRDVAAKRAILARWRELDARRSDNAEDEARAWLADEMIANLAAADSAHPEYDEQWKW